MVRTIGKVLLGLLLVVIVLVGLLFLPFPMRSTATPEPATSYEEAVARFEEIEAEEADLALFPGCGTQLLTNGEATDRTFVLFHGYRGCPLQFLALGELIHDMGYNVLLPRMPQMGYADKLTEEQATLTTDELVGYATEAMDIAHGLGDNVTVAGLSAGGLMTAWTAQYRDDVDRAVIISPFLAPKALPDQLNRPAANLFSIAPNIFMWQDAELQEAVPDPPETYPRNATRPLSQFMLIGFEMLSDAKDNAPTPDSIVVITNAADGAVDLDPVDELIDAWQDQGYGAITEFQFEEDLQLDHDLVDPAHPRQQVELVYPVLLDLIVGDAKD